MYFEPLIWLVVDKLDEWSQDHYYEIPSSLHACQNESWSTLAQDYRDKLDCAASFSGVTPGTDITETARTSFTHKTMR